MKKSLLTLLLLVLVTGAFGQSNRSAQKDWYRNEMFLEPVRFFEGTFALGYQRNFYNSALSLKPSVTLMGETLFSYEDSFYSEQEGFGLEGLYKVYFARMPKKAQVYLGPYVAYRYLKEKNRLPDYIDVVDYPHLRNSDLFTYYNTMMAGVLFGVHFMWGRFTLDMNIGGGIRYPVISGFRADHNNATLVSVPTGFGQLGFKGVVPKSSLTLGVAF
ncbi:MAG: hypothetical protein GX281_05990 [Bacteroidales bacterium]|jgi:hypothetical protein|nr:hypothetical protein [Bacteroidales bacterium]NLK80249.1 hypothetical protein [Bacteroidales bacterium]